MITRILNRLLCMLVGHRWAPPDWTSDGDWIFCEEVCDRCGAVQGSNDCGEQ